MKVRDTDVDSIDITLVRALATDGRRAFSDLAGEVGLSAPSTGDRVRRLEELGVIRGYRADVDPAAFGHDLVAFVAVTLATPGARAAFLAALEDLSEVLECHHVAGDDDYLLKARVSGTSGLERLIASLKTTAGVGRTRTTVVLSTPVERSFVPALG